MRANSAKKYYKFNQLFIRNQCLESQMQKSMVFHKGQELFRSIFKNSELDKIKQQYIKLN